MRFKVKLLIIKMSITMYRFQEKLLRRVGVLRSFPRGILPRDIHAPEAVAWQRNNTIVTPSMLSHSLISYQ